MEEKQFIKIFINPLYSKKIDLEHINEQIYQEVLDLSNWFCIPSYVLNNIIYNDDSSNVLIEGLKKQFQISNLKNLLNKREFIRVAEIYNKHAVDYVFLKGTAINLLDGEYTRHSRDIDILVKREFLSKAYSLLKEIGYRYINPWVSDNVKHTSKTNHLPVLVNDDGVLIELHHRVTNPWHYEDCPLTESMLSNPLIKEKKGVEIKISDLNHLIAHITYHAARHHHFNMGPVFLYDIKYLRSMLNDDKKLKILMKRLELEDVYKKILHYIDRENTRDEFSIYSESKLKSHQKRNSKKFIKLISTISGVQELFSIILKRFKYNEDLYQTSKYSPKFYLILLVELKNYLKRQFKF